ncbi:hypothetical protein [Symbioplanes lichenis]|uniref:hypothetical protein n=1 Tax=Symbioplanes lichenis TaxID=1629072 RepID=UPI0027399E83|nr:hypothetical protein [Actinoplanes lichenis]
MAFRTWAKALSATVGVGALVGASELGMAYGLGVVRLTRVVDVTTRDQWTAQLAWVVWFPMIAAAAGALAGAALLRRWSPSTRIGVRAEVALSFAAALGAAVIVPLTMQPARTARIAGVDPVVVIAIGTGIGALVGVFAAWAALAQRVARWSLATVTAAIWIVALVSVAPSLAPSDPLPAVRLGVLDLAALPTDRTALATMPALALLIGLTLGILARRRGLSMLTIALAGLPGPALLTVAYLIAGPGSGADHYQMTPYWAAMTATGAGVLGSVLAAVLRRPPADEEDPQPATATTPSTEAPAGGASSPSAGTSSSSAGVSAPSASSAGGPAPTGPASSGPQAAPAPSGSPAVAPTPSGRPTSTPSGRPTSSPSGQPAGAPSGRPASSPSAGPVPSPSDPIAAAVGGPGRQSPTPRPVDTGVIDLSQSPRPADTGAHGYPPATGQAHGYPPATGQAPTDPSGFPALGGHSRPRTDEPAPVTPPPAPRRRGSVADAFRGRTGEFPVRGQHPTQHPAQRPAPQGRPGQPLTPEPPRVSAPIPEPRVSAPITQPEPRLSAPITQPEPRISAPISQPEPRISAPISQSEPRISAPVPAQEPRISAPATTQEPRISAPATTQEPRISAPIPGPDGTVPEPPGPAQPESKGLFGRGRRKAARKEEDYADWVSGLGK